MYGKVTRSGYSGDREKHLVEETPVARLVIEEDHLYNRFFRVFGDVKFFGKQMRITLRNCGIIDPESIDDYLSLRGYEALAKVLTEMTPQQVIDEVKKSAFAAAAAAGFPTGMKWELTAKQQGRREICDLQRRRRRSRRVHGPQRDRRRSAYGARRHDHRRLCDRRRQGHHLYPRRISAGDQASGKGDRRRPGARISGQEYPGLRFFVRYRDPAWRRRVCLRRRDGADPFDRGLRAACRGRGRRIRRSAVCSANPR